MLDVYIVASKLMKECSHNNFNYLEFQHHVDFFEVGSSHIVGCCGVTSICNSNEQSTHHV